MGLMGSSLKEHSFMVHPLVDGFPVGALHDSWSWREQQVQCLRRIQANRARDQNRAHHPPIWNDVTMSFASKALDLPCLHQGSRSHCKKLLLHERRWAVTHNSSKEATTSVVQKTLLTCSLCSSPDR